MEREAKCLCGDLSIKVNGDPTLSIVCNCVNCQRRTGAPFGAITYFDDSQILEKRGVEKNFQLKSDSGNTNTTSFCPKCGSTVFFKLEMFEGLTGVSAGCFTDPSMPAPTMSVWTRSKYKWVEFPEHCHFVERQDI